MPTRNFSDQEYHQVFGASNGVDEQKTAAKALDHALDIRKFEIELYWKRAAYFWTFIAATLAGFVWIRASRGDPSPDRDDMSVLLCCLGLTFSFGWFCVNRGSKYWQENWEYHVDLLEDHVHGPLYKVVLSRSAPQGFRERAVHLFTGPSALSVSKINQLISLFVTGIWAGLLIHVLPPLRLASSVNYLYVWIVAGTFVACASFVVLGRSYRGGYWHRGTIRTSRIKNAPDDGASAAKMETAGDGREQSLGGLQSNSQ